MGKALGIAAAVGIGGIVAGFGAAAKTAADFQKELSQVGAVSGATAPEMEKLRATALRIGKDTAFSASEAAKAMGELAAMGVSTTDIIGGAADAVVNLAAAGGTDLVTAATAASQAMGIWHLQTGQMDEVVNRLTGAANVSAFAVEDMVQGMASAGIAASTFNIGMEDTTTVLAALSKAGFQSGSDAGTSFKAMLMGMAAPAGAGAKEIAKLGLNFRTATGEMLPMSGIIQELHSKLDGLSTGDRDAAMAKIFGSDGIRAAAGLMKMTGTEFTAMSDMMKNTDSAAIAAKRMDNLAGHIEALKGSLETAAIVLGTALLPALSKLAQGATELLNKAMPAIEGFGKALAGGIDVALRFASRLSEMVAPHIAEGLGKVRDVAMAIGAVAWGPAVTAFGAIKDAAITIGSVAWGGITAFVGASWDKIREAWPVIQEGAKAIGNVVWDTVSGVFGAVPWGTVADAWSAIKGAGVTLAGLAWDGITAFATASWDVISDAWKVISEGAVAFAGVAWDKAVEWAGMAWDEIAAAWPAIKDGAMALGGVAWEKVSGALGGIDWGNIASETKKLAGTAVELHTWAGAWDKIRTALQPAVDILRPLGEKVLKDVWTELQGVGRELRPLGSAFADLGKALAPILKTFGEIIGTLVVVNLAGLLLAIDGVVKILGGAAKLAIMAITAEVKLLVGAIDLLTKTWDLLKEWGGKLIGGFLEGISTAWQKVNTWLGGIPQGILESIGDLSRLLWDVGKAMIDGLLSGIRSAWSAMTGALQKLFDALPGWMKSIIRATSPSRVFADQVGKPIGEGIAVGILESAPAIMAAMAMVVGGALAMGMSSANAGAMSGGPIAAVVGGTGSGPNGNNGGGDPTLSPWFQKGWTGVGPMQAYGFNPGIDPSLQHTFGGTTLIGGTSGLGPWAGGGYLGSGVGGWGTGPRIGGVAQPYGSGWIDVSSWGNPAGTGWWDGWAGPGSGPGFTDGGKPGTTLPGDMPPSGGGGAGGGSLSAPPGSVVGVFVGGKYVAGGTVGPDGMPHFPGGYSPPPGASLVFYPALGIGTLPPGMSSGATPFPGYEPPRGGWNPSVPIWGRDPSGGWTIGIAGMPSFTLKVELDGKEISKSVVVELGRDM